MEDTSGSRYFITDTDGIERETDASGYIRMERNCGFHPKPGCGPFATSSFSQSEYENGRMVTRSGRIQYGPSIRGKTECPILEALTADPTVN